MTPLNVLWQIDQLVLAAPIERSTLLGSGPLGPPNALLGQRGTRPVVFPTSLEQEELAHVLDIPGVSWRRGAVSCSWDAAPHVGKLMGMAVPEAPLTGAVDLPGLSKYRSLGFHEVARNYQKVAADFLARRSGAMLCDPMRSGKCLMALMADTLVASRRTLFVAPALAKWVWADEILKWTGEGAFILDGLSGRQARQVCVACRGRGELTDGASCPACRQFNGQSYGYLIHEARTISRPIHFVRQLPPPPLPLERRRRSDETVRLTVNLFSDAARRTGEWYGPPHPTRTRISYMKAEFDFLAAAAASAGSFCCTKHADVTGSDDSQTCFKCWIEFRESLRSARYVIVNYDILGAQRMDVGGGVMQERLDLQGWAPVLEWLGFDVVILDESHMARGRPKWKDRHRARQTKLRQITRRAPRVWLLTGTPIFAYVRDLYQQLDIATGGLWGNEYQFDARYCEGHKGEYGWVNTGRSILADTELKPRLERLMLKRARADIYSELPPKTRQVIRIDPEGAVPRIRREGGVIRGLEDALAASLKFKLTAVVDNVVQSLMQGEKCIVFCFSRKNSRTVFRALEASISSKENSASLRRAGATAWLANGEVTAKARYKMSVKFVEHKGAGVFVATTDAFQVGASLRGASSVHFADLHWLPPAMFQAEDRCWDRLNGFTILYYIVNKTVDESFENVVLPRVEMLAKMADEKSAEEMQNVLTAAAAKRDIAEEMFERLTKHLRGN